MARIPDAQINRLKQDISLQRLVRSQGIKLKKHGKDLIGLCPFHDDNDPSLVITPEKNLWHCLGACQSGGSVIDWVMKSEGVSFRHAVELLQNDVPSLAASSKPVKRSRTKKIDTPFQRDTDDQQCLNQVIDYYHQTLKQSPEAQQYLESRGLVHAELIDTFKLGFANRSLGYRLPRKETKDGAAIRGQLQRIGLLRDTGHEHFNGSLVIPVFDEQGIVTEVYGRKITKKLRPGTPSHLYLPGSHQGIFNQQALENNNEIILCESLIDALTFWCAGYRNVTSSYGIEGFTKEHINAFKQHNIERVLIAYDRDDAGEAAAVKLAKQLIKANMDCYRLLFPKGMDANQYALDVTPANKSLGVVIRSAQWMGDAQGSASVAGGRKPGATNNKPGKKITTQTIEETHSKTATEQTSNPSLVAESSQPTIELPAAAIPPSPIEPVEAKVSEHEINIEYGNRHYRVRGLQKNTSYEVLKVNVLVKMNDAIHVDTFDLYNAKQRQAFARVAAVECDVEDKIIQRDLGQLLLQLEALQDKTIQAALKPNEPTGYTMDDNERESALNLLRDPELVHRITDDFSKTGLVGEPTNALMGYLATVSRKLKTPLAIIVQSTSAAGKSALMDAVLKLVPEEDRVHYSAMTGQSLFYLGETDLKHKILGIAEEEGVRQATYALKLLQSEGELTIASTGKDPQSGKHITEEYRVEGPVMLFLTTTAIDIDEELLNRCVVLTINESREQTAAIQTRQRQARTLSGLLGSHDSEQLVQQHQNAQRLLRPLAVVNPYAEQLAFADSRTRTRRDHEKYLTLIESITLLHQYQRDIKTVNNSGKVIEYIEVTKKDIALSNELAHEILGRSLDELPPPTRSLLQQLHSLVAEKIKDDGLRQNEVRFTRREVRESAGLSDKQVRVHLERLVELECVFAHHGKNGQRYVYELVFDGELENGSPQLPGLIDVKQLKDGTTTANLVASSDDLVPSSWPASGKEVATLSEDKNTVTPSKQKDLTNNNNTTGEMDLLTVKKSEQSYSTSLVAER